MKAQRFLLLLITVFIYNISFSQQSMSREHIARIINAYKKSARAFMTLETCGDPLDGPIYLMKQSENYSLDRLIHLTPEQENEIGAKVFQNYEGDIVKNDRDLQKVRNIVAKLAAVSSKPNLNYHVYVVNSDEVNAFSTIGNYIYVTTGLLGFVDNDDELAMVLAHEMSHIINQHVVRKEKEIAAITYVGRRMNYQRFYSVATNINLLVSAPFDQIDEYDADRSGLILMKKAGYDETAFRPLFEKMKDPKKSTVLARFESNHPSSAHREACLNKLISK